MVPRGRGEDPLSLSSRTPPVHFREVDLCCHEGAVPHAHDPENSNPPSPPMGVFIFPTGVPDFDSAGATPGLPRSLGPGWVVCARTRRLPFPQGGERPATSSCVG